MGNSSRPGETGPDETARLRAGLAGVVEQKAMLAKAQAALIRHHAALAGVALEQIGRMGSRGAREREMPMRSIAAELAYATHVHDLTAQTELNDAWVLVTRFAATVDALEAARISKRHADVILDTGTGIEDDDVRGAWERTVLNFAARETPGRTKAYARELAEAVNPVGMTERHARANEARGVSVLDLDDGMALLQVLLPATLAYGIQDRIRRQARAIRDAATAERGRLAAEKDSATGATDTEPAQTPAEATIDDRRTLPQVSADLIADMLLTGAPAIDPTTDRTPGGLGAIRAHVQITVPVTTLTGTTDTAPTLNGQIPIDPATARRLAGDAPGWDRVMCHPITGTVLAVDRYTPAADQKRFLQARDQHCRGFGCRTPAHRCHIDHNHEHHDGGPTTLSNLAHLCTRHHTLKTETEWTARQLPDGTLQFTSPLGNTYPDHPPERVIFLPDGDPPPF